MKRSMGFWRSWALVVGIMVGNGIFMMPALLAPYGSYSLLGWVFAGLGTFLIVLVLGSLAKRIPQIGGPYAYTRSAFGDLPGFLVAWGYWIAIWVATAAGAVAFVGYAAVFVPQIAVSSISSGILALAVIWIFTGINIAGVKSASVVQLITTILKLTPLFLIAVSGLTLGNVSEIPAVNPDNKPLPLMIAGLVMLTMWSFVGVEGITVPADDVIEPEKTIPRAMMVGTLTATVVYIAATLGVMAVVPINDLAGSTSPFADAAATMFGPWGAGLVAIGALVSIGGSLNGNILVGGIVPQAIAQHGLFPRNFLQLNSRGAPTFSLIVSAILASILIVMNFTKGLVAAFELFILLSTLTTLVPYAVCSMAQLYFQKQDAKGETAKDWKAIFIALGALAFSLFAIIGSGLEVATYGLILLAAGLPVFYYLKHRSR